MLRRWVGAGWYEPAMIVAATLFVQAVAVYECNS